MNSSAFSTDIARRGGKGLTSVVRSSGAIDVLRQGQIVAAVIEPLGIHRVGPLPTSACRYVVGALAESSTIGERSNSGRKSKMLVLAGELAPLLRGVDPSAPRSIVRSMNP